MNMP